MNERIEWVEPEEVTRERRELLCAGMREVCGASIRWSLILGVPSVLLMLWIERDPEHALVVSAVIPMLMCIGPLQCGPLLPLCLDRSEIVCALGHQHAGAKSKTSTLADSSCQWKSTHSFEISDHPTLPGIRRLIARHGRDNRKAEFNFRAGQLDEAELRAFVEARLAEARTERLMRRVKQ